VDAQRLSYVHTGYWLGLSENMFSFMRVNLTLSLRNKNKLADFDQGTNQACSLVLVSPEYTLLNLLDHMCPRTMNWHSH
jgi:hypothetical protein